jgi:hypothetical protein
MEEEPRKDTELILKSVRSINESLRERVNKLEKENSIINKRIKSLKNKIERKDKKIKELQRELDRVRDAESSERGSFRTHQSPKGRGDVYSQEKSASSPSASVQQPSKDRLTTEVGQVFMEWCSSAGATMVDRHTMFADRLKERLPEAEVDRVFREKNAAGVFFVEDAQDAVEYWVVRVQGRDLLLPQPNRSGFREVEQCFEGESVAPKEVEEIYPAELRSEKGKQVLKAKGLIS